MADIAQSIRAHNSDYNAHPYLLDLVKNRALLNHTHLAKNIIDLESTIQKIVTNKMIDDENFISNIENELAKLKIPSQLLLYEQLNILRDELAKSQHTHKKSDIIDFEHNHDNYYTKTELNSIESGKGASLIGATLNGYEGVNVQEILTQLQETINETRNNFFVKDPVRVISTQNIKELAGIRHTIDGISNFKTGDRILLAGQIDNRMNGIYIMNSGNWVRSEDMNNDSDLADNIIVFVNEGLEYINTGWRLEVKYNTIAQTVQPLKINKCAIIAHPFSYNRNLEESETIYLQINPKTNVISPNLKPILSEYPTDTIMGRVLVDQYGRVVGGDILGPNGKNFHLEDYNIVGVMTEEEVKEWVQQEIEKIEQGTGEALENLRQELQKYADDAVKTHEKDPTAHSNLARQIKQDILNSEEHFAHKHDDLYYTETELSSSEEGSSGASKIGVSNVDGINIGDSPKTIQSYLDALKRYCDSVAQSLDIKQSVRVATTENITLSGILTIDEVELVAGNRVLVKDQTNKTENGIYIVSDSTWTRSLDADSPEEVNGGLFTFVEEGTSNHDTGWVLSTDGEVILGSTDLTFIQFSRAGTVYAGPGLVMNGNEISMPAIHEEENIREGFTKVTIDIHGKVVQGNNPSTLQEMGIKDAYTKQEVDDKLSNKAGLEIATEESNGLMSKEDFKKLKGIEEGAQKNQNAYSVVDVNGQQISAASATDTLPITTGQGIVGSIEGNKIKLEIGKHQHLVEDISDFPESLPADGGNADTLDGHSIDEFVLHEDGQGASDIDTELPETVNAGISKHNIDENAHQDIREKFGTKADLINGLVPITQLPAIFNIDPVRTAIVGENGNWFYWDRETGSFVDSGVSAKGSDGAAPTIGENGNWFVNNIDTGLPSRGEKGDKGEKGIDGINGKTAYEGAIEHGYTKGEEEFYQELGYVGSKANTDLSNIDNETLYNKGKEAGLGSLEPEQLKNYAVANDVFAENMEFTVDFLQNSVYDLENIQKILSKLHNIAFSGSYNDLTALPETVPPAIVKTITLTSDNWENHEGTEVAIISDEDITSDCKIDIDLNYSDYSHLYAPIFNINDNGNLTLFSKIPYLGDIQLTIMRVVKK